MRTLRIVVLAAGLLIAAALPADALTLAPPSVDVAISPVGGAPGTSISVSGHCTNTDASEGDAYLEYRVTSDAIRPPLAHSHFVVNGGNFSTTLQNPAGSEGGFPQDLNVRATCGFVSGYAPFQASDRPTGFTPTIFASLGETPCGYAFVPAGTDARIPCPAHVKGFDASGALAKTNFYPQFDPTPGASIAVGDFTGDGQSDVITGSGPGDSATVRVSSLDGKLSAAWQPFGNFSGGVNVAVGDVTGDGRNDLVAAAGPGGGPHVLVYSRDSMNGITQVGSFYAYDPRFSGGVNVAAGNARIITGAGPGGGPHVKEFNVGGTELGGFYAYAPNFHGGVNVAASGATIVTGAGAGGGPHVRAVDHMGNAIASFYAYDPGFTGGVSVAIGHVGNATQIVTGASSGGDSHVRVFDTNGALRNGGWYAFGQCCGAGVKVAVTP